MKKKAKFLDAEERDFLRRMIRKVEGEANRLMRPAPVTSGEWQTVAEYLKHYLSAFSPPGKL